MTMQLLVCLFTLVIQHHVQKTQACGGVYTSPSGSISSPLYPSQYPVYQNCTYIINTTQGHRITLTFVTFEIEAATDDCEFDHLEIRDGSSELSPSMGIFCNTRVPDRVRSTSNTMWIRFRSGSQSGTGFNATYSSAIIPQKYLLVTDSYNGIRRIDIDTGSNVTIRPDGLHNPFGIDYDPVDGRVYWSNAEEKTIWSANLDGRDARLVRSISQRGYLWGLSVDSVSRLLFYADGGNKVIGMISLDNNSHHIVVDTDIGHPIDIELDKHNGVMYWSDNRGKIERCNYDGSDRQTFISSIAHLKYPTGLALDTEGRRLYWADVGTHLIGWRDLDGRNTGVYFKYHDSYLIGLDIYHTELFVTDLGPRRYQARTTHIYRIGKNGTIRATVQVKGRVNDVRVYAEETTHKASTSSALTSDQTTRSETTGEDEQSKEESTSSNTVIIGAVVGSVVAVAVIVVIVIVVIRRRRADPTYASPKTRPAPGEEHEYMDLSHTAGQPNRTEDSEQRKQEEGAYEVPVFPPS